MPSFPLVNRFHLLLLGLLAAITAVAYVKIPAATGLPVHWGFDGRPDRIWPRDAAIAIFPVVAVLLVGLFAAIGRLAPPEQVEPGRPVAEAMLAGLLGLFCALQFALILIGVGSDIDMVRIIAFGVAALLVLLGLALPRSGPNPHAGIRLPWTLRDPGNWRASHRLAGVLLVLGGLWLALVAWLWPDPVSLLSAMAVAIVAPLAVAAIFSFVRSRVR
jgi:uncharacterized membrane protein